MTHPRYSVRGLGLVTGFAFQGLAVAAAAGEFAYRNPREGGSSWVRNPLIIQAGGRYFMTGSERNWRKLCRFVRDPVAERSH